MKFKFIIDLYNITNIIDFKFIINFFIGTSRNFNDLTQYGASKIVDIIQVQVSRKNKKYYKK